jgi:CheY-like chemotaxis protein
MPGGGTLSIEAAAVELDDDYAESHAEIQPGPYVLVSVSDTGAGMPAEVRERAFEPFFTTKPVGMGTGLGLSMVYGFLKQSGGHAQIYSEPGRGTTVRLYLPIAPAPVQRQAVPDRPSPLMFPARGETILVVEDDARVRRVSAMRLATLGYRVLEAEDGPRALRLLAEHPVVDLLFTDMVMPAGMTGVDLAHAAREHLPALKVLYTSGYAEPNLLRQGIDAGDVWLRKPYTAFDLARMLRTVLDGVPAAPSLAADVGGEQIARAPDGLHQ